MAALNVDQVIAASSLFSDIQGQIDVLKARKQSLQDQLAEVNKQLTARQADGVTALANLKSLINA